MSGYHVPHPHGRLYNSLLETVGGTPLVCLHRFSATHKLKTPLLGKMEFFNPLSSVKDRIALRMIEEAEINGTIKPGETLLIEPTSGNTGIGLAFVAAAKGYDLTLVMPESMSIERLKMLKHLGANVILTPKEKGMAGAVAEAERLVEMAIDAFCPAQFDNPANPAAHEDGTAEEIWFDTGGMVDGLVAGVGTGGTLTGISRSLKAKKADFKSYAVEPASSPVLSGGPAGPHKIQGIGAGFVPGTLDVDLVDEIVTVGDEDAIKTARQAARLEGLACGISSGAALYAALQIAKRPGHEEDRLVVIIPSFAERYMSTDLFLSEDDDGVEKESPASSSSSQEMPEDA